MHAGLLLVLVVAATRPGLEEDAPPPNRELLEFIASFQTVDGEWIDPMSLPEGERQEPDEHKQDQSDAADAADPDSQR